MLLFFGCTAPIELETRNSEPVIVIYGFLTDEFKRHTIRISSSSPYFDEMTNSPVTDARVTVASSDGHTFFFNHLEEGIFVSDDSFACRQGVTYSLSVVTDFNRDGYAETYQAETTTLPPVTVDSISVNSIEMMGIRRYTLNLSMQEPPETDNYYLYKFFVNDSVTNDKLSRFIISDDKAYNGSYLKEIAVTVFEDANNERFEELPEDNDYVILVKPNDKITLQTLNIEESYYQFISDCDRERRGENPIFGGPPSNIATNISGGGVGCFTSFCINAASTVVEN